jgi:hypothetical protein
MSLYNPTNNDFGHAEDDTLNLKTPAERIHKFHLVGFEGHPVRRTLTILKCIIIAKMC